MCLLVAYAKVIILQHDAELQPPRGRPRGPVGLLRAGHPEVAGRAGEFCEPGFRHVSALYN